MIFPLPPTSPHEPCLQAAAEYFAKAASGGIVGTATGRLAELERGSRTQQLEVSGGVLGSEREGTGRRVKEE